MSIEPSDDFEVDFQLDYENSIIGNQRNKLILRVMTQLTFQIQELFVYEDIEKIKKIGLAKGGSLDNAVVVEDNKVLNHAG